MGVVHVFYNSTIITFHEICADHLHSISWVICWVFLHLAEIYDVLHPGAVTETEIINVSDTYNERHYASLLEGHQHAISQFHKPRAY